MISFALNAHPFIFAQVSKDAPCIRASTPNERPNFLSSSLPSRRLRRTSQSMSGFWIRSSPDDAVTTSTWTVKPVESDEELLDFLQMVLQGYFEDDHSRYVQTFMRQRLESEVQRLKSKYQPNGDKHPESLCLVAVGDQSEVVGGCEVCVSLEKSGVCPIGVPATDRNGFYIQNLIVSPDRRRQGVGNAVMVEMIETIKALDASAVYAHVEGQNDGAVAFYKQLGFDIIEEVANVDPAANLGTSP